AIRVTHTALNPDDLSWGADMQSDLFSQISDVLSQDLGGIDRPLDVPEIGDRVQAADLHWDCLQSCFLEDR
ncbi:hypothetical protein, partial [Stenotrophomonas maltophilia]|uniref:hypothetical protein n=2 Tax=Gammaproteobacteria TaxID=1236 RepID=UPI0013DB44FF